MQRKIKEKVKKDVHTFQACKLTRFPNKNQFILKYFPLDVLQYQLATGLAEGWSREIFPSSAFTTTVNTGTAFQTQIYAQ